MSLGLVGRKIGMTRIFTDDGKAVPVTVLDVANNRVTQIKTKETDGYSAVQVTFGKRRASRVSKPQAGHLAKAGVEAFSNSLRAEVAHLGVKVGVAHPTWIRTDLVESADAHPVFGKLRASMPGLIGKTYPLDVALDDLEAGILKRARTIHVPRWVGGLKLLRAFLPPVIEIGSRSRVPSADRAALADIEARGAFESAVTGHGGRAATKG